MAPGTADPTDGIDTPAVLVDMAVVQRNIDRFQSLADRIGMKVRPHIKTHKLAEVTRMQLSAGAIGITCQKVSEAEAMLDACPEIRDLLITYNILGDEKLDHLRKLARRVRLTVVADNATVVDGLSRAFAAEAEPLRVLVECNTGADRCGVATPDEACALGLHIAAAAGLRFQGLMTYPPVGGAASVQSFMTRAIALLADHGIAVETVSSGGTPSMAQAGEAPVATEYRPGTYAYNDRSLVARGVCDWEDCALTVLATVVSTPDPHRAIIDAGSKALTSDLLGLSGYGHVLGRPDITIDQLSEEHGRLVSALPIGLVVGQRIRIVPNHACVVTNLFDSVIAIDGPAAPRTLRVAARGKVV
ncbi:D-TA family PLP-dependent enzyme [Paragemmobacter straminiformis]|uniref:D-TA family PLP-dependent enzyme n=1 Tax=Paragemmobacter straminiformis TaxID=2045119 RepID=A0A842IAJ4_9RHOB|nr:D-TA family PLP-dependent enzyme [Gemmobacter straminiformis]MBC2836675.1 D-TA family PLP-dependent enzyme [Gemmobacter straminiformis]